MSKLNITKEQIEKEYIENKKSISKMAKFFKVDRNALSRLMKAYGIEKLNNAPSQWIDITDKKFGSIYVIEKISGPQHEAKWKCRCDCGKILILTGYKIRNRTNSCCVQCFVPSGFKGFGKISNVYWYTIVKNAILRDINFNLDIKDAWEIYLRQNNTCALSGLPITIGKYKSKKYEQTASLDRINSDLGYFTENIQWVHKEINRMKWAMQEKRFIELCTAIAEYNKK